jgi:hypothetical protein
MISDETFPIEEFTIFEEEEQLYSITANSDTVASTETFETSVNSSEACISTTDLSTIPPNSADCTKNEFFETTESSFASFASNKKLTLAPPRAPIKQKKSFSCHDLQQKKTSYEHVESKVKKLIESMNVEERRRKILSRHKSMPISTQPILDETYSDVKDPNVLIRELRKKSVQIYELQERNEEKDSRIYSLEYERSKMRMTFDKLRVEMHDLKEKERDYKQMLSVSSPLKMLKNASSQTDQQIVINTTYNNDQNSSHVRELTFTDTTAFLNQTHFSELNNASSDNLIPDVMLDDINNATRTVEAPMEAENEPEEEEERKKKKKFQRFLKLMSCVSK